MDGIYYGDTGTEIVHFAIILYHACNSLFPVTLGAILSAVEQEVTVQKDPAPTNANCASSRGEEEGDKGVLPLCIQHPMQCEAVHLYSQ